jgi:hypothetical protein
MFTMLRLEAPEYDVDETTMFTDDAALAERIAEAREYGYQVTERPATLLEILAHLRGTWCAIEHDVQGEVTTTIAMPRGEYRGEERFTTKGGLELFLTVPDELLSIRPVDTVAA